ncbi:hypothetical protein [Chloroflexus aggregans]|uniref:Uncharacterized protein n=1 Tax=Chloroflexus aggregans (strain MD-66 / DSM 9485) TaxID=326427 RepID=B8G4C4_CHLAD|nr:hypothetical protein [Chloroflexus aggregans]ACL23530.1 conserved hypothetical protein [Chloroflexus aggregans DSM 9485]
MPTLLNGLPTPHPALVFTRAERDQAVIFEPACASLFRPLVDSSTLQPWHTPIGDRWLLVIPPGYSRRSAITSVTDLIQRHPGLNRRLSAYTDHTEPLWWEMPSIATAILTAPTPRILIGTGEQAPIAWDSGHAIALHPIRVVAPADHLTLALLTSRGGRIRLRQASDTITLPAMPIQIAGRLAELAAQAVAMAHEQQALAREFARRLLADFGPPGSTLSPALHRWWELEFRDLLAEVHRALRNPIPEPFQPFWAARHAEGRSRYYTLAAELAAVAAAIDELANPLWDETWIP